MRRRLLKGGWRQGSNDTNGTKNRQSHCSLGATPFPKMMLDFIWLLPFVFWFILPGNQVRRQRPWGAVPLPSNVPTSSICDSGRSGKGGPAVRHAEHSVHAPSLAGEGRGRQSRRQTRISRPQCHAEIPMPVWRHRPRHRNSPPPGEVCPAGAGWGWRRWQQQV